MADVFSRFSPFIKEYIYSHGWEELREIQTEAARVIFETDKNLLLTTPTASGKTEAAFFPILSELYENPAESFGVIYIAPLKSLINDQFSRMEELLDESGIPVYHWHGDVAVSKKAKALKTPRGILQITPESLESMLINRSNDIPRLFSDLRYVVVDELHTLTGSDRGNQILCQLYRLSRLIGFSPRRVGLSATVGDVELAAQWLSKGSGRETVAPKIPVGKLKWRLGAEHFYIGGDGLSASPETGTESSPVNPIADGAAPETDTKSSPVKPIAEGSSPETNTKSSPVNPITEGSAPETDTKSSPAETSSRVAGSEEVTHSESTETQKAGRNELEKSTEAESLRHTKPEKTEPLYVDKGYNFIYDCVKNKKSLVFSNSREETEYITATLRQIAEKRGEPDIFSIHHGNLSAAIREEAESDLKSDEITNTTCATVTLELGIDIGRLERIVQSEAPNSVSSLLQRIGRSGRRGAPPEMMMVFREEQPLPNTPLPDLMPWQLLQAIACIQLYAEERFIEPPFVKKQPFSLCFHQTLSVLKASGELTPKALAGRVLSLPPFENISKEDYRTLLVSMITNGFIEKTETGTLIVGLAGEKLTESFKFYAVFKDSEDFTVRCGSDEIGTITTPPPVGDRFALAGRVWEVEETDVRARLVFVKAVGGKMEISWPGDYGEIHTKILKRMKKVLSEDTVYPYLKENARKRLDKARAVARKTGMLSSPLTHIGGYTYALFPWVGTKEFRTVRKTVAAMRDKFKLSSVDYSRCYYITFRMEGGTGEEFLDELYKRLFKEKPDLFSLSASGENPIFDKFDTFIPAELLRRAYSEDRLKLPESIE